MKPEVWKAERRVWAVERVRGEEVRSGSREMSGIDLSDSDAGMLVAVGAILVQNALQYYQLVE